MFEAFRMGQERRIEGGRALPRCTVSGVMKPIPDCRYSVLYQVKKAWQCARASSIDPKRSGKSGRYLSVLNWVSEYGLSPET